MKIAYFINDFPSYTQTFVLLQIVGMIERGHQVCIYARRKNKLNTLPKAVVKYRLLEKTVFWTKPPNDRLARIAKFFKHISSAFPKKSHVRCILATLNFFSFGKQALSLQIAYDALPFLADGDFDIIHCQFGMLGPIAINLRKAGIVSGKVVTSFRGFDTDQYLSQFPNAYDKLFSEGDLFLPVQKQFAQWLSGRGASKERTQVLRSGIDCKKIPFANHYQEHSEVFKLISVARLVEKKGLIYAIQAVADLVENGIKASYSIIGDGPLHDELSKLIDNLHMRRHIHLRGWMQHDAALEYMHNANLLLAPSITTEKGDKEGIPNVLKEAMALGLPVLSTWHSGIPELVSDGDNGFLVPEKDNGAIFRTLLKFVEEPDSWQEFSLRGRQVIERDYDISKLNDKLEHLYRSVLAL